MQYPVRPMLALAQPTPRGHAFPPSFRSGGWLFEPKLDGIRAIAWGDDGRVRIQSRPGNDITATFPEVASALAGIPFRSWVLDGELVMMGDDFRTDFHELQNHRRGDRSRLRYVAFDVLELDGDRLTGKPLRQRKTILAHLVPRRPPLDVMPVFTDGVALWQYVLDHQLEGVIAKPELSRYLPNDRGTWLKFKRNVIEDFTVVGYTAGTGHRSSTIGALVLARQEGGRLVYAGKCGTGFDQVTLAKLLPKLQAIHLEGPPTDPAQTTRIKVHLGGKTITWVNPLLTARVEFNDYAGPERVVRMGSFKGLVP